MRKIGNNTRMVKSVISRLEAQLEPAVADLLSLSLYQTSDGDCAEISITNVITIQLSQITENEYAEMLVTTDREVFNKCFLDVDKAAKLIHKKIGIAMRPKPSPVIPTPIQGQLFLPAPVEPAHTPKFDGSDLKTLQSKMAALLNKSKENK